MYDKHAKIGIIDASVSYKYLFILFFQSDKGQMNWTIR